MAAVVPPSLPAKLRKAPPPIKAGRGRARVLITVTVLGSAGPLRFLVDEGEAAAGVIRTALKSYAREGRRPVLGSNLDGFVLYYAHGGSEALNPGDPISFNGYRNFVLCKKEQLEPKPEESPPAAILGKKRSGSWKAGLNRLLNFGISAH